MPKSHKRGPYSIQELEKRRTEVYPLHFEYGYSARKIAELMRINRNTINGDIKYWYSKISKNNAIENPESAIIITVERLDLQRTRLREYLDKVKEIPVKLSVEKLIYDIDGKISHINQHLAEWQIKNYDNGIKYLNAYLDLKKDKERYLSFRDKIVVSKNAFDKIEKIITEDRKTSLWRRQN